MQEKAGFPMIAGDGEQPIVRREADVLGSAEPRQRLRNGRARPEFDDLRREAGGDARPGHILLMLLHPTPQASRQTEGSTTQKQSASKNGEHDRHLERAAEDLPAGRPGVVRAADKARLVGRNRIRGSSDKNALEKKLELGPYPSWNSAAGKRLNH